MPEKDFEERVERYNARQAAIVTNAVEVLAEALATLKVEDKMRISALETLLKNTATKLNFIVAESHTVKPSQLAEGALEALGLNSDKLPQFGG